MERVKLSTLQKDTIVLIDRNSTTTTVEDILEDLENYKTEKVYTTTEYNANLDAKSMLDDAIDYECENNMYEDWNERIQDDITKEDIKEIQSVLDRILKRSLNIAYYADKLIEFDI